MNVGQRKRAGLRRSRSPARRTAASLRVELLEPRIQLSSPGAAGPWPLELELDNDSLDRAVDLGDVGDGSGIVEHGSVGGGPAGAADVEWYSFKLERPARVTATLGRPPVGSSFRGVLSLYNSDTDYTDSFNPHVHRRLNQAVASADGVASLGRVLGPGTYSLAVSGAGNLAFHPLVPGSGLPGSTGDFDLRLDVADAGPAPGDGPAVLASEPASGAILDGSPFVIRLALSGPLDPWSINPGQTVQLEFSPDETFGDEDDRALSLAFASFSASAGEIQLIPAAPLAPGHYRVSLVGDGSSGLPVLTTPDGLPLGMDGDHPWGRDFSYTFRVAGIEGDMAAGVGGNDTPETSRDLGPLTPGALVQVGGAIGDDPFYNFADAEDPYDPLYSPGNDVDLYHFRVVGPGRHAFLAEVFARRIGSPLDPGLSLYRLDPETGSLQFLAGNNNTSNPVRSSDGQRTPLFSDSVLFQSLEEGDYYLAVADGFNTPSPLEYLAPGSPGLFDPTASRSGWGGFSTGPYLLNLIVHPSPAPPVVSSTSWEGGATMDRPPTHLAVGFDRPMNLPFLAFRSFQETTESTVSAVYLLGADGTKYFPRFDAYDGVTNRASFLMLDALTDGDYELHLSGPLGLTDLAGNPLVGNDPGGDYVVRFRVEGPARGHGGDPLAWVAEGSHDDLDHPQDLGVLFPRELVMGVTITRAPGPDADEAPSDRSDFFRFRILQQQFHTFRLSGDGDLDALILTLRDDSGQVLMLNELITPEGERFYTTYLDPGTYILEVGGSGQGEDEDEGHSYQVLLTIIGIQGNAPPLLSSPAPAVALRFDSVAPPAQTTPLPPVTAPSPNSGGETTGGGSPIGGAINPGGGTHPGSAVIISPPNTYTPLSPGSEGGATSLATSPGSLPRPEEGRDFGGQSSMDSSGLAYRPFGDEGSQAASTLLAGQVHEVPFSPASAVQGADNGVLPASSPGAHDSVSTGGTGMTSAQGWVAQYAALLYSPSWIGLTMTPTAPGRGELAEEPSEAADEPGEEPLTNEAVEVGVHGRDDEIPLVSTEDELPHPDMPLQSVPVLELARVSPAPRAIADVGPSVVGGEDGETVAVGSPGEDATPIALGWAWPALVPVAGLAILAYTRWRRLGRSVRGEGRHVPAADRSERGRSGDRPRASLLVHFMRFPGAVWRRCYGWS